MNEQEKKDMLHAMLNGEQYEADSFTGEKLVGFYYEERAGFYEKFRESEDIDSIELDVNRDWHHIEGGQDET